MLFGFRIKPSLALAASCAVLALQSNPAQAITTWNWSFTTNIADQYGSGTFTTADVVPTAGVTYPITAISGTYNRAGTIYNILGLSTDVGADNTFQWNGTSSSPIIATYDGISFQVSDGVIASDVKMYYDNFSSNDFEPISETTTSFPGSDGSVSTSSLNPVPGPLPLFGAAVAYSWSRRLRRRIAAEV